MHTIRVGKQLVQAESYESACAKIGVVCEEPEDGGEEVKSPSSLRSNRGQGGGRTSYIVPREYYL